jgi:hypothetical protein
MAMKKMTGGSKPVAKMEKMAGKASRPQASAGKSNPKAAAKGKGSLPKSGLSRFEPKSPYANPTKVKARGELMKKMEKRTGK